jgi:hypothetical protein
MTDLPAAILAAVDWYEAHAGKLPEDVGIKVAAMKTYDYFVRKLSKGVRDLYNSKIDESEFVTMMQDMIPQQLTRAWNEGMRSNGIDPETDMTDEWSAQLEEIILAEYDYVDGFAADITISRDAGDSIEQFISRAELWANRYNDVVNQAKDATAEDNQRYEWELGPTEEHCESDGSKVGCANLAGTVATMAEWRDSGIRPQSDTTVCGGWRCQCTLNKTNKPLTGGIPTA